MNFLSKISMGQLVIVVGIITTIGWIALEGAVPLIISIVAGGLIALKGMADGSDDE